MSTFARRVETLGVKRIHLVALVGVLAYFTIEPNDTAGPCVAARYRLTLLAR